MLSLIDRIGRATRRYARYRQTRDALASLPLDVALDLDIYPGDAARIARAAVYGP